MNKSLHKLDDKIATYQNASRDHTPHYIHRLYSCSIQLAFFVSDDKALFRMQAKKKIMNLV